MSRTSSAALFRSSAPQLTVTSRSPAGEPAIAGRNRTSDLMNRSGMTVLFARPPVVIREIPSAEAAARVALGQLDTLNVNWDAWL